MSETVETTGTVELTFSELRRANQARRRRFPHANEDPFSLNDWLVALGGELGELMNLTKKLRRGDFDLNDVVTLYDTKGQPKTATVRQHLADELGDAQTYLDIVADVLGIDLGTATVEKWNAKSAEVGLPDRIGIPEELPSFPRFAGWTAPEVIVPAELQLAPDGPGLRLIEATPPHRIVKTAPEPELEVRETREYPRLPSWEPGDLLKVKVDAPWGSRLGRNQVVELVSFAGDRIQEDETAYAVAALVQVPNQVGQARQWHVRIEDLQKVGR